MEIIRTNKAPAAVGPYAQAVKSGNLLFCSGQIPLRLDSTIVASEIKDQTKQVMENLREVLAAAGTSFERVVKTTIYLVDMNDFAVVNEVYGSYFEGENKPARATVAVAALPKGAKVEIDCIAEV